VNENALGAELEVSQECRVVWLEESGRVTGLMMMNGHRIVLL